MANSKCCCNCCESVSFKLTAVLGWNGIEATPNAYVDLDLYVRVYDPVTKVNDVVYWNNLSGGGLTLNHDAGVNCLATSKPPPESITGSFTSPREFTIWFNQYSACGAQYSFDSSPPASWQNGQGNLTNLLIQNTGKTNIRINSGPVVGNNGYGFPPSVPRSKLIGPNMYSIVTEFGQTVFFDIDNDDGAEAVYAGYNTGTQQDYYKTAGQGLVFSVLSASGSQPTLPMTMGMMTTTKPLNVRVVPKTLIRSDKALQHTGVKKLIKFM